MRPLVCLCGIGFVALALSGCAAVEVGSAVVGAGVTVVSTTAHVAGSAVGAAGRAVTGGSDEDKKKDDGNDN